MAELTTKYCYYFSYNTQAVYSKTVIYIPLLITINSTLSYAPNEPKYMLAVMYFELRSSNLRALVYSNQFCPHNIVVSIVMVYSALVPQSQPRLRSYQAKLLQLQPTGCWARGTPLHRVLDRPSVIYSSLVHPFQNKLRLYCKQLIRLYCSGSWPKGAPLQQGHG